MDLELAGKRAVVTGGSRGIGKAVARQLLAEGATVVIAALSADRLRATADELAATPGGTIVPVQVDTGSDDSVRNLVGRALDALGGIDILVNSAARPSGQDPAPHLADITDDRFWGDVNVKVMGSLRCMREVAPYMKAQRWGRIINVSGLGARQTGNPVTSMRNSALAALTKNVADELGPFGINVTVVHPGLVRTEATAEVMAARARELGVDVAEVERRAGSVYAIRRFCDADEVATVIVFLASPKSVSITGDAVVCSGGVRGSIYY